MSVDTAPSESSQTKPNPLIRALLGLLLLLPACGLCSLDQLALSVNTLIGSFQSTSLAGAGDFVGMQNYQRLFSDPRLTPSFGFTFSVMAIHVITTALPLLLAFTVNALGKKMRLGMRLLFTLPLAFFGPALVMFGPTYVRGIWNLETPSGTYLLIDGMASLAVACGLGLIVYLAVLRGRKETEGGWRPIVTPLVVTWLIAGLAAAAYAMQSFNSLSGLLPTWSDTPLGYALFQTFRLLQGGLSLALSTVILVVVAVLGIIATLVLVISKVYLKQETPAEAANPPARGAFGILGWIVLIIGGIAVFLVTVLPMLLSVFRTLASLIDGSNRLIGVSVLLVWINSILPPLLVILLIQLPVAYLGAIGIGVVRPLGRRSQWLLLLFSPWLFVTSVPIAFAAFQNLQKADLLDSPLSLVPPILLSVPMLFILTLFFMGQEHKLREARAEGMPAMRAFFKHLIIPSLPLAVLMAAVSLLVSTQDLLMPLLAGFDPDLLTATTAILKLSAGSAPESAALVVAAFGLPISLIFFIVFAALQVFHLERLVITREATVVERDQVEMKSYESSQK
jgi:hypothetical protein